MRRWGWALAAVLLAGCSGVQLGGGGTDPAGLGSDIGTVACVVAATERPELRPQIADAIVRARAVLTAEHPTGAALSEAMTLIEDEKTRAYVVAGATVVLRRLGAADMDVLNPDSDAMVGVKAFLDACEAVAGVTA